MAGLAATGINAWNKGLSRGEEWVMVAAHNAAQMIHQALARSNAHIS